MKVREIIRVLREDGWRQVRARGSHRIFSHAEKPGIVVVPGQMGDDVPLGTLRSMLKQAGLEHTI